MSQSHLPRIQSAPSGDMQRRALPPVSPDERIHQPAHLRAIICVAPNKHRSGRHGTGQFNCRGGEGTGCSEPWLGGAGKAGGGFPRSGPINGRRGEAGCRDRAPTPPPQSLPSSLDLCGPQPQHKTGPPPRHCGCFNGAQRIYCHPLRAPRPLAPGPVAFGRGCRDPPPQHEAVTARPVTSKIHDPTHTPAVDRLARLNQTAATACEAASGDRRQRPCVAGSGYCVACRTGGAYMSGRTLPPPGPPNPHQRRTMRTNQIRRRPEHFFGLCGPGHRGMPNDFSFVVDGKSTPPPPPPPHSTCSEGNWDFKNAPKPENGFFDPLPPFDPPAHTAGVGARDWTEPPPPQKQAAVSTRPVRQRAPKLWK